MAEVLALNELVVMILGFLDIPDLLRVEGVSKYFKRTIKKSIKLQRQLFFEPAPSTSEPQQNTLLAKLFPVLLTRGRPDRWDYLTTVNVLRGQDWCQDPVRKKKMLRAGASWRRMFPVQPPAKLEKINIVTEDSCLYSISNDIEARLGSTFGGACFPSRTS
ncbi:hypothetical protein B0I35DRAFT_413790 [Stachybotrys elegans]|uniref:F-box domain-containing protein n=1 Tax=Stachybotrys elegans TaxID=80388 RepID=A0A8K0SJW8_9HYPO|nr:hypothetical protein B0I35DRAFT_413790 [Stachybotrys elegans]